MNSLNDLRFFELDIICFCEQMFLEIFGFRKFAASSYAQISFFRRAFFFFFVISIIFCKEKTQGFGHRKKLSRVIFGLRSFKQDRKALELNLTVFSTSFLRSIILRSDIRKNNHIYLCWQGLYHFHRKVAFSLWISFINSIATFLLFLFEQCFEILESIDIFEDKFFYGQCLFKYETKYYRMSKSCGKQPAKNYLAHA